MEFIEKYGKQLFGGIGLIIVIGFVTTLFMQNSVKKEKASQEKYFALEAKIKKYTEEKFKKSQSDQSKNQDKVNLTTDVATLKSEIESFISQNLGTVASQFAGLELAQILIDENKTTEALSTLQKIETQSQLLSNSLVKMKIAQILVDLDKCTDAIANWSKIISTSQFSYLHNEAKLNQALCYKKMSDFKKAEEILNQVKNDKSEESTDFASEADRILRLIQFNKTLGT
ncbi:MAG: tetratricopeptide repeat protein [Pseudobdellovibrio sp.]